MADEERGLAIVVADRSPRRLDVALSIACAAAALGRAVSLFFSGEAVAVLGERGSGETPDPDAARARDLLSTAVELGATVTVCQTALADAGLTIAAMPPFAAGGGLLSFLAETKDSELLLA